MNKLDLRIKAAELAVDSNTRNVVKKAKEIYDFLTEGLDITDQVVDTTELMSKVLNIATINPREYERKEIKESKKA